MAEVSSTQTTWSGFSGLSSVAWSGALKKMERFKTENGKPGEPTAASTQVPEMLTPINLNSRIFV